MCKHVFIIFVLSLMVSSSALAEVFASPQDKLINQFDSTELTNIRNSCCPHWTSLNSNLPPQACIDAIRLVYTQSVVIPVNNQHVAVAFNPHAPTAAQVMANSPSNGSGSIGYGSMICAASNGPGR